MDRVIVEGNRVCRRYSNWSRRNCTSVKVSALSLFNWNCIDMHVVRHCSNSKPRLRSVVGSHFVWFSNDSFTFIYNVSWNGLWIFGLERTTRIFVGANSYSESPGLWARLDDILSMGVKSLGAIVHSVLQGDMSLRIRCQTKRIVEIIHQ